MSSGDSKYVERKKYLSRYTPEQVLNVYREEFTRAAVGAGAEEEWLRALKEDLPKFIPFLTEKCGITFRGRILEIGAGGAWLSAELSKLPGVVEVIATDILPETLKEQAPKVFKLLKANTSKIIREPADFHQLLFPDNHFDFVVCSAGLRHAANVVQVLREAKRVLKPGGRFIAIREPVLPLMRSAADNSPGRIAGGPYFPVSHYEELFKQANFPVRIKRVNLSTGFRFFLEEIVNGITHAHYAFIGVKQDSPASRSGRGARARR